MKLLKLVLACLIPVSMASAGSLNTNPSKQMVDTKAVPSSFSVNFLAGTSNYWSSDSSLVLGLNPVWDITGRGSITHSDGQDAEMFELGAEAQFIKPLVLRVSAILDEEPYNIRGSGPSAGASWKMNSLWDSTLMTKLSIDAGIIRYKQTQAARLRRADDTTDQTTITIKLTQDITDNFTVGLKHSAYSYSPSPTNLTNIVRIRRQFVRTMSPFDQGFLDSSTSVLADWLAGDAWDFGLTLTQSTSAMVDGQKTRSAELSASYEFTRQWTGNMDISLSRTDGIADEYIAGAGVTYSW